MPGLDVGTVGALKVMHPHLLETPDFFKRFLREAEIGKSAVHENVVRTYDADAVRSGGKDQRRELEAPRSGPPSTPGG